MCEVEWRYESRQGSHTTVHVTYCSSLSVGLSNPGEAEAKAEADQAPLSAEERVIVLAILLMFRR